MSFLGQHRLLRRAGAALGLAMIATLALTGTAHADAAPAGASGPAAANPHLQAPYVKRVEVKLTTECVVDPKAVHQGDDLRKACSQPNAITPKNTVSGNCGYTYLYVYNLGSGTAGFSSGAHSYLGTILYGSALISWINVHNWWFGSIPLYVHGNYWSDWSTRYTASGTVVADMEGDVLVSNGAVCSFDHPTDVENIS